MLNTSYLFLVILFVYACGFNEPEQRYKPIKTIDVNVSNSTQSGEDENADSKTGNSRNGTAGNNDESNNVNNNNDSDAENEQNEANGEDEQNEADAKAKEEADAKAKEEADAKAKEEADAKAKEEADAKAAEEAALALIQMGQTLYEDNCNQCHPGNDLASDPRLAGKDQQAIDTKLNGNHPSTNLQDGDTAAIAAAIAALEN
ncbi:MAG: cytochrome c [Oligoflexales bacterium]